MRKVKVLFFAADPLAVLPHGRTAALQLGDDVREVRERVEAVTHPSAIEFDWRLAARTEDLVKALRQTRPQVVHFSGHGEIDGLVLTAPGGRGAKLVDGDAIRRIFEVFSHRVRLVVLSACYSTAQAEAIADVVGCAIGTSGRIDDADAILFDAAFYSAIACGESVQTAFDQASAELELSGPRGTRPELLSRKGVNPARRFLVPRFRRTKQTAAGTALILSIAALIASWPKTPVDAPPPLRGIQLGDCASSTVAPSAMSASTAAEGAATSGVSSGAAADLAEAKALCAAGNYEAAFPLFKRAAQAGEPEAMGFEGIAYLTGEGTHREPELGVELLRDAAQKGDLRSMTTLATAYQNGYGVKQPSDRWAKHWLRKAAMEMGDAEAMRRLGVFYREERNDSSLIWLPKAIDAGSGDARVDLGLMYHHGRMVTIDTAHALDLYRTAAGTGSRRGMFAMGEAYKMGFGVPQSYDSATAYYLRAACTGSGDAMNALGVLYQTGLGVSKDPAEAIRWFRLADAAGSEVAAGNLRALKTPDQPRRWRGPVAGLLKWLGLSEPQPELSCASAVTPPVVPQASPP